MDEKNIPTLAKNFPDVLLALLKRMPSGEQSATLKKFQADFPKDFDRWYTADVARYLSTHSELDQPPNPP